MDNINVIIVDDEANAAEYLATLIKWELKEVNVIECFTDPDQAIRFINKTNFNLLFLDIEMPKKNGFQLLKECTNTNFKTIFTTAHDGYAIEAFKTNAISYLLKPIMGQDLVDAVEQLRTSHQNESQESLLKILEGFINNSKLRRIALPSLTGLDFLNIDDILRLEADRNYTYVHVLDNKKITISKTLKDVIQLMDFPEFIRIHHSHYINLKFIKKYINGRGGQIVMIDGSIIPVSRSHKEELIRRFK